jgi:hypothetical protein
MTFDAAAASFYNAVNYTPEQPDSVITGAPVPVSTKSYLHSEARERTCGSDISVLEYFASEKSGAVLQGEQLIS